MAAIFLATDPAVGSPLSERVQVVTGGALEDVLAAAVSLLGWSTLLA